MHESEPIVESARSPRPLVAPFSSRPPVDSRSDRPLREGLPPGFRMRADAHYVDQLDARVATLPVRLIAVSALEAAGEGETLSPAFVGSIRRFGVLQPLLVTERDGRYRVIAGRRRAAAARLLGLPDVPCIVHHVEDAAADEMTAATNLPGAAAATQREPAPETPALTADLTQVLTALVSCAELLTSPSTLAPAAASALVRAEALRALDTLIAARVLRDEMPAAPARVTMGALLDRLGDTIRLAREVRGFTLDIGLAPDAAAAAIEADVRLVVSALAGLIATAASLVEGLTVRSASRPAARVCLQVQGGRGAPVITIRISQHSVAFPAGWLRRPFEAAWPMKHGRAALLQLQAARHVARAHGGTLTVEGGAGGSAFVLTLPVVSAGLPSVPRC